MERLRPWSDAAKPDQAVLAPLAVEIGAACAHYDARPAVSMVAHVAVLGAAYAAAIGVNLVDHLWDVPGHPPPDPKRPIPEQDRLVDRGEAAGAAGFALAAAALLGCLAAWRAGAALLGYGVVAVALGLWRRAPYFGGDTLGFGLGDLATAIALGPLAVATGFAMHAGEGSNGALIAGLAVGAIATAAAFPRHVLRADVDAALKRATPLASLGTERTRAGPVVLLLAAVAVLLITRSTGDLPRLAWVAAVPLAAGAVVVAWSISTSAEVHDDRRSERVLLLTAAAADLLLAALFWLAPAA